MQRLVAASVIQGDHLVVDASLFQAYSNPRKRDGSGTPSDPEASWGFESSTGQWVYGYKLHVIACADAELPIALAVTTGKRGDSPRFPPLLAKASHFAIPLRVVGADGNYHVAVNHLAAHQLGAATVIPQAKAGKIKVIAFAAEKRHPNWPDIPSTGEAGLKGYEAGTWFGIVTRAGVSRSIINNLNREIIAALNTPELSKSLTSAGFDIRTQSPDEFGKHIKADRALLGKVIKAANIKLD